MLELAQAWTASAEVLERYGDARGAALLRAVAGELQDACASAAAETLTLGEAAEESGYSERRLRELVGDGSIPNAGRRYAPRIRRGDLPRKVPKVVGNSYDPVADAHALLRKL